MSPLGKIAHCMAFSLFLVLAAQGQQLQRIAIMGTEDDGASPIGISEQMHLTDKLREIAGGILPKSRYMIMTQQSIVDRLGSEEQAVKLCREATCLVDLGRKVNADYIAQARIGRFGENLTIKVELYQVARGALTSSFTNSSKDIQGLLEILEAKSPDLFRSMPGVVPEPPAPVAVPELAPVAVETVENEMKGEGEKKGVRFGVRAGVNLNNFSLGYKEFDEGLSPKFSGGVGLALNVPITGIISLNTGLDLYYRTLFSGNRILFMENDIDYINDTGMEEFTISIPILIQLGNSFYFTTGIQLDIPLSTINGGYLAENRSAVDAGFVLGLGYMFGSFGFDFKYVYGLTGLFEDFGFYDGDWYIEYKDKSWLGQYCFGVVYFF